MLLYYHYYHSYGYYYYYLCLQIAEKYLFFFHLYMTLKLFYDWSCWTLDNERQWDELSVPLSELHMHQQEITWPSKWLPQSSPHWLICSDFSSSQDPSCYHALKTGHEPLMKAAPLQGIISQLYLSVIVYEWIPWQQGAKWTTGIAKHF